MYYIQQYRQFASQKVMWICNVLLPLFKFNWKEVFILSRKNIKNQASQNFYMLHKALFVNEKYKKLSDSAKVTYAILNDRVSLSIKNNWIDDNGDIYFIHL